MYLQQASVDKELGNEVTDVPVVIDNDDDDNLWIVRDNNELDDK
jgi:hypothetical protein